MSSGTPGGLALDPLQEAARARSLGFLERPARGLELARVVEGQPAPEGAVFLVLARQAASRQPRDVLAVELDDPEERLAVRAAEAEVVAVDGAERARHLAARREVEPGVGPDRALGSRLGESDEARERVGSRAVVLELLAALARKGRDPGQERARAVEIEAREERVEGPPELGVELERARIRGVASRGAR